MTYENILSKRCLEIIEQQGWTEKALVIQLARFINQHGLSRELERWFVCVAAVENGMKKRDTNKR